MYILQPHHVEHASQCIINACRSIVSQAATRLQLTRTNVRIVGTSLVHVQISRWKSIVQYYYYASRLPLTENAKCLVYVYILMYICIYIDLVIPLWFSGQVLWDSGTSMKNSSVRSITRRAFLRGIINYLGVFVYKWKKRNHFIFFILF